MCEVLHIQGKIWAESRWENLGVNLALEETQSRDGALGRFCIGRFGAPEVAA